MALNAPENAITVNYSTTKKKLCLRVLSLLALDSSSQKLVRDQVRLLHV